MKTAQMIECPECKGAGGFSEDCADSRGEHTTRDSACDACQGAGEVEARCYCCRGDLDPMAGFSQDADGFTCAACLDRAARFDAMPADATAEDFVAAGLVLGQPNVNTARAEVRALLPGLFS